MATLLFTTSDVAGARQWELERLFQSIADNETASTPIRSYVLLQNCTQERLAQIRAIAPSCCELHACPGRLSLSEARNTLLRLRSATYTPAEDDVIGFPDDDCWLPAGFVGRMNDLFDAKRDLDVFICRMSLDPTAADFDATTLRRASIPQIVRLSSSNNIFVRGSILARVGMFDPALGVGTSAGSAEDTDFVIRASMEAAFVGLVDRPLIGHREPDRVSAAKYFRGALIVLARHCWRRPGLMREFLRKLLVGLYFVAERKMTISIFGRSIVAAAPSLLPPGLRRTASSQGA